MSASILHTPADSDDDTTFNHACHLLDTELNARPIRLGPAHLSEHVYSIRQHKAELIRAVNQSIHVHYLTEAFRIVDAVYPHLTSNGRCTDAAITAACEPLYGGLAGYRVSTQRMLAQEARDILTHALATVADAEVTR